MPFLLSYLCICPSIYNFFSSKTVTFFSVLEPNTLFYAQYFFLKDGIYLFMRNTEMCEREAERHRQREKQAPCWEPDVGLDPRSPGSRPGPKAGAKPLSHPGIPYAQY